MKESVSASIHFQGNVLFCTEIERNDPAPRVRCLERRTFGGDVEQALAGESADSELLDQIVSVVEEVLGGTEASRLHVALSPVAAYSFFVPIAAGSSESEKRQQVKRQSALVTGTPSPESFHLATEEVRTEMMQDGDSVRWVHVLALPQRVAARIQTVAESLPVDGHVCTTSTAAAATLVARMTSTEESSTPYRLAVGQYPTHTEYALTRHRSWHYSHAAQAAESPEDRAYYAVRILNRLGVPPQAVDQLFVYGASTGANGVEPLESVFEQTCERLDPFNLVVSAPGVSPGGERSVYVPCIGAGISA